MTSITFVDSEMSEEEAKNVMEAILDHTGWYAVDKVLVNNKVVWRCGDRTLAQVLGYKQKCAIVKDVEEFENV